MDSGYNWVITDTADEWHSRLENEGKRNIKHLLAEGQKPANETLAGGWYRRHMRDFSQEA